MKTLLTDDDIKKIRDIEAKVDLGPGFHTKEVTVDEELTFLERTKDAIILGKKPNDNVEHPMHYISKNGIETIDVIDAWTEGLIGIDAVDTANIIKYISRWHKKNGLEDLKKARWYLNHLIERLGKER